MREACSGGIAVLFSKFWYRSVQPYGSQQNHVEAAGRQPSIVFEASILIADCHGRKSFFFFLKNILTAKALLFWKKSHEIILEEI